MAKKQFDKVKHLPKIDKKYRTAEENLTACKTLFQETDRSVFEWLYILDEYKGRERRLEHIRI